MICPLLAIESSCDETAASVVVQGAAVSHTVVSQVIHKNYGGVVPELAARAHQLHIVKVVEQTLEQAKLGRDQVKALAVTQGPGLLGSLLVGIAFANGMAQARQLPLIGVHHTKAHLMAAFLSTPHPSFPFLGIVVSGGHTQLVVVKSVTEMSLVGTTLDDAIGEAFDKIAKMMGMPYPGGNHIDSQAKGGNPRRFTFPLAKVKGLDFSFSGIKTAFRYFLKQQEAKDPDFLFKNRQDLCASIQASLVTMIIEKLIQASKKYELTTIVVGGGVANNSELRRRLKQNAQHQGWHLFIPPKAYCSDNAAMIAIMADHLLKAGVPDQGALVAMPQMAF